MASNIAAYRDGGEGPGAFPCDEAQIIILEILERHFGRTAHLVEIELLSRLPRDDLDRALGDLSGSGMVVEEVRRIPGRYTPEWSVFRITCKGLDALYGARALTRESQSAGEGEP